ncbi:GGDEF domain-containing protein [uncultured Clostridium sp.]|uniref:transporter substrate-binding domain-containing diguanylate cyclase n=1 Tax=uncultured Clostridium sp. TaxID=59620 RepID=UPI0025FE1180|nr:GGDEF domain-containing protein [uncultured Clostridium sp.]
MKEKKKTYLTIGLVTLFILLVVGVLIYINNSKSNYSFSERSFINSKQNSVIDIGVQSSLPIFSNNGTGVFYDFINFIEKDTSLTFNVSTNSNQNYNFINKNELSKNDYLVYLDHFVLVSTNDNEVNNLNSLSNIDIAVMSEDYDYVSKYLSEYSLKLDSFDHMTDLIDVMGSNTNYAILPLQKYINEIVYNDYKIVKHLDGLHSHYVINFADINNQMSNIFIKAYNKWKDNLYTSINTHLLNLYYNSFNITELDKDSLISDDFIVGYVDNMPIEGKVNRRFSGINNEYLNRFSDMTGVTYKYIKYKNRNELINALNDKKVDIVYNYYNISNDNYKTTHSLGNISFVILVNQNNTLGITGLNSIYDDTVKMVGFSKLESFIKDKGINTKLYNNYGELLKDLADDDILITEKGVYEYYRNTSLKDYVIKYIGYTNSQDNFLISNDNNVLYNLFNYYISTLSGESTISKGIYESKILANKSTFVEFLVSNLVYIILAGLAIIFLLFKFNRRVKVTKKIRKEDKMMYLDVMTNLKNRNYLNDNLSYWEENKVYPQAIVIVDLNSISVINDTKGHEEGDKQIQSAAGILIKTQRENSEIIRTDGNEFLIYLVGYEENQIVTYVNKLMKEFKNLPYEYGASIGYFMITSESTTIDDAINEAVLKMRENKGE